MNVTAQAPSTRDLWSVAVEASLWLPPGRVGAALRGCQKRAPAES